MVGLSTFAIPYKDVASRITAALLILLCALIYRLYMQPSLPVIAYWTALVRGRDRERVGICSLIPDSVLNLFIHNFDETGDNYRH